MQLLIQLKRLMLNVMQYLMESYKLLLLLLHKYRIRVCIPQLEKIQLLGKKSIKNNCLILIFIVKRKLFMMLLKQSMKDKYLLHQSQLQNLKFLRFLWIHIIPKMATILLVMMIGVLILRLLQKNGKLLKMLALFKRQSQRLNQLLNQLLSQRLSLSLKNLTAFQLQLDLIMVI